MLANRALAPTTFLTGPEDSLATADVYEIQSDTVINDTPPPITVDEDSLANELRGGNSMLAELPIIQQGAGDIPVSETIDAQTQRYRDASKELEDARNQSLASFGTSNVPALNKISALNSSAGPSLMSRVSGGGLTGIPGLSGGGLTSLTSVLGSSTLPGNVKGMLNAGIPSQLGTSVNFGGLTSQIAPGQINQSYQMGSLINNLTGGNNQINIVDRDSSARLISALAIGGMSSGMPNSFSALSPLAGGDQAILTKAAQVAMNYASSTGNIKGMGDVVNAMGGPTALIGMGSSVFSNFSKNYQSAPSVSMNPAQQTQQDFTEVTQTFSRIDPDWARADKYTTDPATGERVLDYEVVDISVATEGNSEFKSMMQTGARSSDDPNMQCFAMTNMFDLGSPEQELGNQFPMTATSINTDTTPNVTSVSTALSDKDSAALFGDDQVYSQDDENYSLSAEELHAKVQARKEAKARANQQALQVHVDLLKQNGIGT